MTVDNFTTPLKRCNKCKRDLPADEIHFYRDRGVFSSPCKECRGYRFSYPKATPSKAGYAICTKCGRELELTEDNFYRSANAKSGFNGACRECFSVSVRQWQQSNPEKKREYSRRNYQKDIEKSRERARMFSRQYRLNNPEKIREGFRQWYHGHPERRLKVARWRQDNREKTRQYARQWQRDNPEKKRVNDQRRRARELSYPDTLTHNQWHRAIAYFNGCCAVCGKQANDLFNTHTIAADHWIPLAVPNCPGTVATNIVPLCHGQDGCNNSKNARNPQEWLIDKFGKRKAAKILARIEDYFAWVRAQDKLED